MSPVVDETAGDLPVRDVGLMRGGLMPTMPDPQRLFRFPREHLEDLCLRLQEENSVLKQHTRTQEQRLRRMSTRLSRLRQARPGSGGLKDRDMEATIQELEARVATLESQKGVLQNKLSLAKQHIVDLGARTPYKLSKAHTLLDSPLKDPPLFPHWIPPSRCGVAEQVRMAELELTAQALRDTLKDREREMEGTVREMKRQQADRHRINIRENVDLIRLQKQLSEKSAALRVSEEKFTDLQEVWKPASLSFYISVFMVYESFLPISYPLSYTRRFTFFFQLQDRISDLEGERDQIKENFDTLLESQDDVVEKPREVAQKKESVGENVCRTDIQSLEEALQAEREERVRLEQERDRLRYKLEKPYVTLSLQLQAFRIQQENRQALQFLQADGTRDGSTREQVHLQASHAETVLELQKARNLLVLEHQITKDLQEESKRRMAEKNKLLSKRALQINTLQGMDKITPVFVVKRTKVKLEAVQPVDDDRSFSQLRAGESLLEIHLKAATFTPAGLRLMSSICPEGDRPESVVTFCTYSLLDFEVHSTPLVLGSQPSFGFTSRYTLTARDLGRLGGQGSRVRVEMHQALGGVRFVTHGSGQIGLMGAMERRGEIKMFCVWLSGHEGEIVGVVDFWVRLFPPAEPLGGLLGSGAPSRSPLQQTLGWQHSFQETILSCARQELHDYGGGIPNELLVMLEHCVGLSARWPGVLPDAYLTYRLYDLPPHVSPTVQCSADPVFNDAASYPLAVTTDVLHYLRSSSLWVYVFDDSDDQVPPAYLSKTPVPLRSLATGKEIRGDYVLRDAAGGPRGMVRVTMRWKYPFQPPADVSLSRQGSKAMEIRREEAEASQRPVAKPRVKVCHLSKNTEEQPVIREPAGGLAQISLALLQDLPSVDQVSVFEKLEEEEKSVSGKVKLLTERCYHRISKTEDAEGTVHGTTCGKRSGYLCVNDVNAFQGDKLRVEILSLTFEPSSHVALDESVQRVYVEYRLLGVPMETTETPMSLRKPTEGEEIHYNFTRVIYVDGSQAAPLRQYLYTMLEGTDPNQGRLKFTVVSEPMDDDDECVDVGHAFLDLKELLLSGNDVIEEQIDSKFTIYYCCWMTEISTLSRLKSRFPEVEISSDNG
uniref:RPGR interacting protein 1 n=1 Tax=Salarias fasciatus TaxID=181472 RepID=A0A672GQJ1_SALFA